MNSKPLFSRYTLLKGILFCYFLPLLSLSTYGAIFPRESADWNILSLGILLTSCGSLGFFWMMTRWEESLKKRTLIVEADDKSSPDGSALDPNEHKSMDLKEYDLLKRSPAEAQQTQIRLLDEIELLTGEVQKHTVEKLENLEKKEKLEIELERTKSNLRQQLEKQQDYVRELQDSLAIQKAFVEKKQQYILQLETKVSDLTTEIKTLLKFAETHTESFSLNEGEIHSDKEPLFFPLPESIPPYHSDNLNPTPQQISQELKHCLDIAQKIKGSQRFGSQIYSFLDSPADSFSLDLRRLCDRLRSETQSAILLHSPKDNHLLFVSNPIKTLTGWNPEKFMQNFTEILLDETQWSDGVATLTTMSEVKIVLQLKNKAGAILNVNANIGRIPTGIFRNHTIAILYP